MQVQVLKGSLTIIGFISPSGQTLVRLGYLVPTDDPTQDKRLREWRATPIEALQFDASNNQVGKTLIPADEVHADPDYQATFFLGKLPLDDATRRITLSQNGTVLATVTIPVNAPHIELTWRAGAKVGGVQKISWEASHTDGVPLEFTVFFSNDGGHTYRQLSQSITDQSYVVDFDRLPGGTGQIKVLATDGGNTSVAVSPPFAVAIKPVFAMILSPADNATVEGQMVTLQGQGYQLEEDAPELEALTWTSSIDGALGTGRIIQKKLSPGEHTIQLMAGSEGHRQGSATITLNVR